MMDLIDRAAMHEDSDVEALRNLAATISVEGDEPSPRVMTDGGHPRPTAGWRSPLGGPRFEAEIPDEARAVAGAETRDEEYHEMRQNTDPEDVYDDEQSAIRTDGGSHASRIAEQLAMAEGDEGEDEEDDDDE